MVPYAGDAGGRRATMRLVPRRLARYDAAGPQAAGGLRPTSRRRGPAGGAEAIRRGAGAAWGPRFGPDRAEGSGDDARHRCARSRRGLRLLMHGPKKLQRSYASRSRRGLRTVCMLLTREA